MTMITPSYLGETIEYSSLHACRSTLEDPTIASGNIFPDSPLQVGLVGSQQITEVLSGGHAYPIAGRASSHDFPRLGFISP